MNASVGKASELDLLETFKKKAADQGLPLFVELRVSLLRVASGSTCRLEFPDRLSIIPDQ